MDLRHLRYFVAVAETGSLSLAAEKLFIAQPPQSVQIRQLEATLGCALFVRHPKGVWLTSAGLALLPEARVLLDRAARLRDVVRGAGAGITIAFVPSASSTVLPALVRHLRQQQAGLDLVLREMISSEQAEALVAGRIDAGLARMPARHPRLSASCVMPDPFCLAHPALPPPATPPGAPVDLQHYAEHDFVGFTRHRGPAYFDRSIHLCQQAGFSPRIRYEASTVHGVLDLVGAGLGVALVPASTALLRVDGVALSPLRRSGEAQAQVLALLRRQSDVHPLLPMVEAAVEEIFRVIRGRIAHLL
jgi:DNA-binding transcriptional LysR family regulator